MTFHGSPPARGRRRPLSQQEIETTDRRIRNIVGDPARDEFSDDEFAKWSERQVDRTTDIDGRIVNTHIEPFKPAVKRQDLNLDGSVGDKADNFRRDVLGIKKVMSKAGAFDFDPGNEPTTVANDRFKKAIRTFQAGNDLAQDGRIFPGGPTVHALGFKAMGQENGRPPGFDAADFKQNFGRDPNLNLSGNRIFPVPGEGGGKGTSRTQEAMVVTPIFPGSSGSSDGLEPPTIKSLPPILPLPRLIPKKRLPKIPPHWIERIERWIKDLPPIVEPETRKPVIGKTPAHIFKYADGRVYLSVDERGKIDMHRGKPGPVVFEEIKNKAVANSVRETSNHPYPTLDDRRSFREREAAGEDGYVYGPVFGKGGVVTGYVPLVDPSSRSFLGGRAKLLRVPIKNGIILTLAQIKAMGLSKWHVVDKLP